MTTTQPLPSITQESQSHLDSAIQRKQDEILQAKQRLVRLQVELSQMKKRKASMRNKWIKPIRYIVRAIQPRPIHVPQRVSPHKPSQAPRVVPRPEVPKFRLFVQIPSRESDLVAMQRCSPRGDSIRSKDSAFAVCADAACDGERSRPGVGWVCWVSYS